MSPKSIVEARTLKGFRDFLPRQCFQRQKFISSCRKIAELSAFEEIATPALEYREVLLGAGGDEADKEVYAFEDHGQRQVALRFDLTVPFARYVAEHQGTMAFPFRKFQVGEVWRGEKPQKGRYRQFCQADFDIIGSDHYLADVEVIACIFQAVSEAGLGPFCLRIGNRQLLSHLIQSQLGALDTQIETKVLIALDKWQKVGRQVVTQLILSAVGERQSQVASLLDLLFEGNDSQRLDKWKQALESQPQWRPFAETLASLEQVCQHQEGKAAGQVVADLGLARGLGYYTGIVFEVFLVQQPEIGSVASGGRYDRLISRFSKKEYSGVGGSVGVDRLLAAWELQQEQGGSLEPSRSGLYIALATPDAESEAVKMASHLRAQGVATQLHLGPPKLAQQFKHADRCGCAFVLVLGEEELRTGRLTFKCLSTGKQEEGLNLQQLTQRLKGSAS